MTIIPAQPTSAMRNQAVFIRLLIATTTTPAQQMIAMTVFARTRLFFATTIIPALLISAIAVNVNILRFLAAQ